MIPDMRDVATYLDRVHIQLLKEKKKRLMMSPGTCVLKAIC